MTEVELDLKSIHDTRFRMNGASFAVKDVRIDQMRTFGTLSGHTTLTMTLDQVYESAPKAVVPSEAHAEFGRKYV